MPRKQAIHHTFVVDGEEIWPRTVWQRYGIFRVKDGGRPEFIAACRTQGEIGTTLVRLGKEGEFEDYVVGVMDGRDHQDAKGKWIGKWIVRPWVAGGPSRTERRTDAGAAA